MTGGIRHHHHATGESSIEMSTFGKLCDTNHNVGKWAISSTINQQSKVSFFAYLATMIMKKNPIKGHRAKNLFNYTR